MDPATRRALLRKPERVLGALREIRRESIEQAARGCEIAVPRLVEIERGEVKPSARELEQLARYHHADLSMLLDAFGYR